MGAVGPTVEQDVDGRESLPQRIAGTADRLQRRFSLLGFPYGVIKKYGEDAGARQSALLTYYGFLSSIPILLIVVWSASQILRDDPQLRDDFIAAVVPDGIADAVNSALESMPTSPLPLVIGILGLLFTGNGIVFTAYEIINQLQGVPHRDRFGFFPRYLRAFATLLTLLLAIGAIGGVAVLVNHLGSPALLPGLLVIWLILCALLLASVALLSARPHSWRPAIPAVIIGGTILTILTLLGSWALTMFVGRAGAVYGPFAAVVGLFSLFYIVSQGLVFSGEIAVVLRKRLWPRSLVTSDPTTADERSLLLRTRVEERTEADSVMAAVEASPSEQPSTDVSPEDR